VRVVHDHREGLALVDRLEAAGHLFGGSECARGFPQIQAKRMRDGERRERVGDVEIARQRDSHVDGALGGDTAEARADRVEGDVAGAQVGLAARGRVADALSSRAAGEVLREPATVRIVEVDH
jgi:hypothetical protein